MIPSNFPLSFSDPVARARVDHRPVVALESTVITHGLPYPDNLILARDLENEIAGEQATPATIALLDGKIQVGLTSSQLERLATAEGAIKVSRRNFGLALARGLVGGTTVAGTMHVAHQAGIQVFATGGIGGVHRNAPFDVSNDLMELGRTPMVVVCAGAKSILDLPATLEVLETQGVLVLGYQTDEFPAFFSRTSGLALSARSDNPEDIAAIARAHWQVGVDSAILVVNPLAEEVALDYGEVESYIRTALQDAEEQGVHGSSMTPYLLARINELSGGRTLQANLALLRSNARLAARIAVALVLPGLNRTM
ncbi:MAG: pseudouridine-5'-phosphate glycosidase [Bellilinea sp.]